MKESYVATIGIKGHMADEKAFDEVRTDQMIDLFVTETSGLKQVA